MLTAQKLRGEMFQNFGFYQKSQWGNMYFTPFTKEMTHFDPNLTHFLILVELLLPLQSRRQALPYRDYARGSTTNNNHKKGPFPPFCVVGVWYL